MVGLNRTYPKILDSISGLIDAKASVNPFLSFGESRIILHFPYRTLMRSNEGAGEERGFLEGSTDFILDISILLYFIKPDCT